MRAWAALCSSLSRAGLVAHTSVSLLFGLGPRCYLALAALAPRIPLLRWLPLAPPGGSEQLSAYGVDCSCYFTDNIYVKSPVEGHFDFHDATRFEQEYAEVLSPLSPRARDELLSRIRSEVARRRGAAAQSALRQSQVHAAYRPLHPSLWTLSEDFLHEDFVSLVRTAECGGAPTLRPLAEGVFALPVFSGRFCALLCEELTHFAASGLPMGRPNSMNTAGVLLGELGLGPGFLEPFLREWLAPLCAGVPALAEAGGADLDHHKSFVVRYQLGEDEQLSAHYDNAEVTLNINLGLNFEGGELLFHGRRQRSGEPAPGGAAARPFWFEWGEVGSGVLHLGQHVHSALPITEGERLNLVVWMRSARWRRDHGCPMCDRTDGLLP